MGWSLFFRNIGRGVATVARQLTITGWLIVAALLAVVLLIATCAHHSAKDANQACIAAEERAKALDDGRKADNASAVERVWDIKINLKHEKELTDAVEALPDDVPSARRIALACERLRQQGTRDADLPARCRSGG